MRIFHHFQDTKLILLVVLALFHLTSANFKLPVRQFNVDLSVVTTFDKQDPFKATHDLSLLPCGESQYKHPFGQKVTKTVLKLAKQCHPTTARIVAGKDLVPKAFSKQPADGCFESIACAAPIGDCSPAAKGVLIITDDINCAQSAQVADSHGVPRFSSQLDALFASSRYFRYPVNRFKKEIRPVTGSLHLYGGNEQVAEKSGPLTICGANCKKGLIVLGFRKKEEIYMRFHLNPQCNVIKICFTVFNSRCEKRSTMTLFTKNGMVILPYESRAVKLDMSLDNTNPKEPVRIVNVGWGHTTDGKFYVSNVYREIVEGIHAVSPSQNADEKFVTASIVLDDPENCIHEFGITGSYVSGSQNAAKPDTNVDLTPPPEFTRLYQTTTPSATTTTKLVTFAKTTTPEPQQLQPMAIGSKGGNKIQSASQVTGEGGWMTWALFYGFVCGIIATGLVAAIFIFIFRRSIYSEWYRGMYKRYGCDASGTTGGVTGAAFGNTTTGAQTMAKTGMTLGGTTGGGTTTGTTMTSGTTGGTTADTLAM